MVPVSGIEPGPFRSRHQCFTADPYHHLRNIDKNFLQYSVSINIRVQITECFHGFVFDTKITRLH